MRLIKFTRLRWRTKKLVLYTIFLLAIVHNISPAKAKSPDGGDYGSDAADIAGTPNQNDNVYETTHLQVEGEASERRADDDDDHVDVDVDVVDDVADENDSDVEMEDMASESATKMQPMPFKKRKMFNESMNHDKKKDEERQLLPLSNEDSDEMLKNLMRQRILTTLSPNNKQQQQQHQHQHSYDSSDYIDETVEEEPENLNIPHPEFTRQKKTFAMPPNVHVHPNPNTRNDQLNHDEIDHHQQRSEKKHKQLLPRRQNARNFNILAHSAGSEGEDSQYEEYYDDEDILRERKIGMDIRYPNEKSFKKQTPSNSSPSLIPEWIAQFENKTFGSIDANTSIDLMATQYLTTSTPITSPSPSSFTSTTTDTAAAAAATQLPSATTVPLAPLGPFITTTTTTESSTGLPPSTLSPLSDTLVPATPETTTKTTSTATITTVRPGGKQGKQINILRRKLQPHEKLRNYIEDAYIRMPLAVIVDPSSESLEKTKALWRDALRTNFNIKIILVSLNDSGIPVAYNFNNTRQFLAGLNSIKPNAGGDAFIGVVHASELVPYDSAVFISTAALSPHTELVQDAAITLLKKRIRLYLLWFGERSLSENETQEAVGGILGEVAIRSGGDILHIVGSENSQELEGGNPLVLAADAFRGAQEIEIPVDTTLSSLHVKIDAPTRTAILETPNGDVNLKKLFKLRSRILSMDFGDKGLDAYVPLTKLRKADIFTLKIIPQSLDEEYNVFVRADRKPDHFLEDMIQRFETYFLKGFSYNPIRLHENRLQDIALTYKKSRLTHENLKFPEDIGENDIEGNQIVPFKDDGNRNEPKSEVETFSTNEIHGSPDEMEKTNTTETTSLADTPRIGSQQQQVRNLLQMSVTKIEMAAQSQVLVAPGTISTLMFEVTNTRSEAVYHSIQVVDERRYLLRLLPQNVFLQPGQTTTVTVTIMVPQGTPQGTTDRITFTCQGSGTVSLSVNLKVTTNVDAQDTIPPTVTWSFGSRCDNIAVDSPNCAERFWTLDITAQDWETGILRLQSTPTNRLFYRNSYTVGSSEPLKATYSATCCEPKVSLIAYDIAGNQRSYNIDVRDIVLTEATIAAIVLGALLLLLLVILIIWGIVYCCRRRKMTLDIPTYRSHSTRSME